MERARRAAALGGREVRWFPALVSSEAEALAWARRGAPDGAVVVADYQIAARGRAGEPWSTEPGSDLGFSVVTRPGLPSAREGWLYVVAAAAVAAAAGKDPAIRWPDVIELAGGSRATVAVTAVDEPTVGGGMAAAVVSFLVTGAGGERERERLMVALVAAFDELLSSPSEMVLSTYRPGCTTLGEQVLVELMPVGPAGERFDGTAVDVRADGSLVLERAGGARICVLAQHVGRIGSPPVGPLP